MTRSKTAIAALVVAALLGANSAQAKPKASKEAFACTLTELTQWEMPDAYEVEIVIAVRVSCHNGSAKTVRLKRSDVYLLNTEGQRYRPDRCSDSLDAIYEDEDPGPAFVDHFVDIAKGETQDLGFTFTGNGLIDPDLTLDIFGTKYKNHRAPTFDYTD